MEEKDLAARGAEGVFLRSVLEQVKKEIKESKSHLHLPANYEAGQFWRRAKAPFFVLRMPARPGTPLGDFGAGDVRGFVWDVFVWLPSLLLDHDQPHKCDGCQSRLNIGGKLAPLRDGATVRQELIFGFFPAQAYIFRCVLDCPRPYYLVGETVLLPEAAVPPPRAGRQVEEFRVVGPRHLGKAPQGPSSQLPRIVFLFPFSSPGN